jgi:hypothetical protein
MRLCNGTPHIDLGCVPHRGAYFGHPREYPPDHAGCRPCRAPHRRAGSSIAPAASACLDRYPHVVVPLEPNSGENPGGVTVPEPPADPPRLASEPSLTRLDADAGIRTRWRDDRSRSLTLRLAWFESVGPRPRRSRSPASVMRRRRDSNPGRGRDRTACSAVLHHVGTRGNRPEGNRTPDLGLQRPASLASGDSGATER